MRMMIRTIGMCCIFFSCILAGVGLERQLKQRWLFLREVKEMLQILEREMTWHRMPLSEALKSVSQGCRTSLRSVLLYCVERVGERGGESFETIWHLSVNENIPDGMLNDTEYRALLDLETALCNTDAILQKTQIQKQQQHFTVLYENAQAEWKEKGQLYRRLSVATGLAFVILLL